MLKFYIKESILTNTLHFTEHKPIIVIHFFFLPMHCNSPILGIINNATNITGLSLMQMLGGSYDKMERVAVCVCVCVCVNVSVFVRVHMFFQASEMYFFFFFFLMSQLPFPRNDSNSPRALIVFQQVHFHSIR